MPFPEKLARMIELRGISQSRLARETGIAQPKISAMSAGKQRPYMDQAIKLARALDVPLDWLADDDQDELPQPDPDAEDLAFLVRKLGAAEVVRRALLSEAVAQPGGSDPPPLLRQRELPAVLPEPSGPQPRRNDKRPDPADTPTRRGRT